MQDPIPLGLVSELIAAIYDSAIEPARWPATLEAIAGATGFVSGGIAIHEIPSMRRLLVSQFGHEPRWLATMDSYSADISELWGGYARASTAPIDEVHVNSDIMPPARFRDFAVYREWFEPQGLADAALLILARNSTTIGTLGFNWPSGREPIGGYQREFCRLLLPHLQRATAISRLLDIQSLAHASVNATLDALRAGVVLLTRDARIVFANDAAQAMLQRGKPAANRKGYFAVGEPLAAAALEAAVRQSADDEAAIGRRGFGIPVRREGEAALVLHVLPLRHGALRRGIAPDAAAAVFISDPAASPDAPLETLAALFDLTSAEGRVFQLLAQGESRERAAGMLGISLNTMKTHLNRIYAKTGATRASQLVKLAAGLAAPA